MSDRAAPWRGVIEEYRDHLPVAATTPVVTLLEGNTPLLPAPVLSDRLGVPVYLKVEGANPTGSFKDRGMTLAISKAVELGARAVVCASTGNTSASAAAYAARAGLRAVVLIPEGMVALGKLAQAVVHGAEVVQVEGNFDTALDIARTLADTTPIELVNSVNPFRIEGQKTVSFEVCEALGDAPAVHCLPVGNAGNITAHWKGYVEAREAGMCTRLPRMWGFQAAGAAPLVHGAPVPNPETVATAIRIGNPASWHGAVDARDRSEGRIDAVTDEQILEAYELLGRELGVFVEPASAAAVAGLLMVGRAALPPAPQATVVCTVTGHGLKDPDRAIARTPPPVAIPATLAAVRAALGV